MDLNLFNLSTVSKFSWTTVSEQLTGFEDIRFCRYQYTITSADHLNIVEDKNENKIVCIVVYVYTS